jgi:hypothetical protein
MAPKCKDLLLEATNAVNRLMSSGRPAGGEGRAAAAAAGQPSGTTAAAAKDDDDDVIDETEERQKAKRQRQADETIDLDMFTPDPTLLTRENAPPQQSGLGKVKAEPVV